MREDNGKTILDITVNGKVYNNSSIEYSAKEMEKIKDQMSFQIRTAFSQSTENFQVNMNVNLKVANEISKIQKTDHVFQIVDQSKLEGSKTSAAAITKLNGLDIRIGTTLANNILNSNDNPRTIPHEVGHSGGLGHPEDNSGGYNNVAESQRSQNLMTMSPNVLKAGVPLGNSRQITKNQYDYIYHQYQQGNLNKNSPLKTKWILAPGGLPILIPVKYLRNEQFKN